MPISRDDVARIASLARLALDPEEIEAMTRDLGAILGYVETLAAFPLDGEEGDDAAFPAVETPFRDDRPREPMPSGEATAEAPGANHDLFRVPPAIGGN
jgi:aspartyl-tRNA(Asn)/glutamyl-tRNA(Gln) amidotransferase subunit C